MRVSALRAHANLAIFATKLVAEACRFTESVKISFPGLPLAVKRDKGVFQTGKAKAVGIAVQIRLARSPGFTALDALVHHKALLS